MSLVLTSILAFSGIAMFATAWWIVFTVSMRCPNNGNEFSEDGLPGGPSF